MPFKSAQLCQPELVGLPAGGLRDAIRKIQGDDAEKIEAAGRIHGKMKLLHPMQLRVPLTDLYAAPGFIDPAGDTALAMSAERVAMMYSFLPAGTKFELMDDCLIITCPDPGEKKRNEAAGLFERAAKRAREGDHEKAIQQYESGLALDVSHTTARRDLAMSRMATRDMRTFEQAGRYYQELAKRVAAETIETAEVETLAREAERVSGFPAQFEDEDLGVQICTRRGS
jgi:hypothetical protein